MHIALQILIGLATIPLFLLALAKIPLLVILAIFGGAFFLLSKQQQYRVFSINFLIFFALIFLIEVFFAADHGLYKFKRRNDKLHLNVIDLITNKEYSKESDYFTIRYPSIGYGPRSNAEIEAKKHRRGKDIYDVVYTINKHGLRHSGGVEINDPVLFFGGSFTYGEGVNDSETMPYIFTQSSKGKYQGYNFGFHGYGPQQMLGALEGEVEKEIIADKKPKYVVFQTILDHIKRAATTADVQSWSRYETSPKYYLDENDEVQYFGTVQEYINSLPKRAYSKKEQYILDIKKNAKSYFIDHIYAENRIIAKIEGNKATLNNRDADLYLNIIAKARDIVKERYEAEFKVILWDVRHDDGKLKLEDDNQFLDYVKTGLSERNIDYSLISDIMPNYDRRPYSIPKDGHPSVIAHQKIAEFLLQEME